MDGEQIVLELTSTEQTIRLNGPLQHDKFNVKWVQVVGANYPVDTVYFINIACSDNIDIGITTHSNVTIPPYKCIAIPLTAATSTYAYDDTLRVLNRSNHGAVRIRSSNAPTLVVRVTSNTTNPPVFTRITVCLEA